MRFRDHRGRWWVCRVDIGAAIRLRDLLAADLLAPAGEWAAAVQADTEAVVNAAFIVCEPQAAARGLNDRGFGRLLRRSRVRQHAAEALADGLRAFFPPDAEGETSAPAKPADRLTWPKLWQLAGLVGVDPRGLTLAELMDLHRGAAEHRSRIAWQPASLITSALCHGKVAPDKLNPWTASAPKAPPGPRRKSLFSA